MSSNRKRLREARAALSEATSYAAWLDAAESHDAVTGASAWRADDTSEHYDAESLRSSIARMRTRRTSGDSQGLTDVMTEDLYRHLGDLGDPSLYTTALGGTKHLVSDWLDEAERCLDWLATADIPGLSAAEKRAQFALAHKVFGRSALLLSGGATWGFHHLGVVKALFEQGLLPHILSGASTGAMIAAGVCARNDTELAAMFADTGSIRLDGLVPRGVTSALKSGSWLDPARLHDVLRHNVGDRTFAEAFAHSGRALNISVSPVRRQQKARLLCWMTAPDVLVASAALASSALPVLFPPVQLEQRRDKGVEPYIPGELWVDGSLQSDLPKLRLARLHNVNHFIVSQTNPHVVPFVRQKGRRGVRPAVAGVASATLRSQATWAADLARRSTQPLTGQVGQLVDHAHALVNQDYRGDIDIHPRLDLRLLSKVVSNPSRADLETFILEGQRSVWPKIAQVRAQTRLSRAFARCVASLRSGTVPVPNNTLP